MSSHRGPILLLGANGMLGRAWRSLLDERGIAYIAPTHKELDLADSTAIERLVDRRFTTVINCAAWTDVDGAETQVASANRINGTAVGTLARRCIAEDTLLIHYSTDYVFNGQGQAPYSIDHAINPVNAYGHSKSLGEQLLEESGCRRLLIRTSWLYAPWGNNFVRTIAKLTAEREVLKVVNDQRGRPTSAEHLAQTTLNLIERNQMGTFHVTDGGECTWFEFAQQIAKHANPQCRVESCATDEFPRPAKRPAYSVLDLSRVETVLSHPMPHWHDNIAEVLRKVEGGR